MKGLNVGCAERFPHWKGRAEFVSPIKTHKWLKLNMNAFYLKKTNSVQMFGTILAFDKVAKGQTVRPT